MARSPRKSRRFRPDALDHLEGRAVPAVFSNLANPFAVSVVNSPGGTFGFNNQFNPQLVNSGLNTGFVSGLGTTSPFLAGSTPFGTTTFLPVSLGGLFGLGSTGLATTVSPFGVTTPVAGLTVPTAAAQPFGLTGLNPLTNFGLTNGFGSAFGAGLVNTANPFTNVGLTNPLAVTPVATTASVFPFGTTVFPTLGLNNGLFLNSGLSTLSNVATPAVSTTGTGFTLTNGFATTPSALTGVAMGPVVTSAFTSPLTTGFTSNPFVTPFGFSSTFTTSPFAAPTGLVGPFGTTLV